MFDNVTVSVAAPPPPDTQAPTIPTGLTATSITASSVSLSWSASTDLPNPGGTGVGGYYVYRNGNTTTPIATVSGTSFTDTGLAASTTYSYQVAAFDKATPVNVSAPSGALSVTTQSTVAPDWGHSDIGAVNAPGSFSLRRQHLHGHGLRGRRLQHRRLVPVRVPSSSPGTARSPHAWSARPTPMPGPRPASCSARRSPPAPPTPLWRSRPANGIVFQGRPTTGGSSTTFNYGPLVAAPYWVRLVRAGSTFTASISPDGTTWSRSRPDHDQHGFPDLCRSGRQQSSQRHLEHRGVRQRRGNRPGRADRHTSRCLGHLVAVTAVHRSRVPAESTWSVDGIGGGNSTVGTISSAGLYTPGSSSRRALDCRHQHRRFVPVRHCERRGHRLWPGIYTYHNDLSRDGVNSQEYALTPADVNTSNFGKLFSCAVDGAIYGQPLWVANMNVNGARHNVVFVDDPARQPVRVRRRRKSLRATLDRQSHRRRSRRSRWRDHRALRAYGQSRGRG